jgi:hypothetical protein
MDFVWFSGSSDTTGQALAEGLGFNSGKKSPDFSSIANLVCWGARPGSKYNPELLNERIVSGGLRILNHPERVAANKDKVWMLSRLQERGVPVPGFLDISTLAPGEKFGAIQRQVDGGHLSFPLLLMSRDNQGQPAFVYTLSELETSISKWAAAKGSKKKETLLDLARAYTHGVDYRVHVFRDSVIAAQVKQAADDPAASLAVSLRKKMEKKAKVEGLELPNADNTMDFAIRLLAEDLLLGPHQFQRTIGRGCEMKDTPCIGLPEEVAVAAIQALDAVELDMGAVNISWDEGAVSVTNVISYPALTEGLLGAYVAAIQEFASNGAVAKKEVPETPGEPAAPASLVASLTRRIKKLSKAEAEKLQETLSN